MQCFFLSLNVRLDAQGQMRTLVLATLDIGLSDSRDVRPGHVAGGQRQREFKSSDQGIENGFDPTQGRQQEVSNGWVILTYS